MIGLLVCWKSEAGLRFQSSIAVPTCWEPFQKEEYQKILWGGLLLRTSISAAEGDRYGLPLTCMLMSEIWRSYLEC